MGWPPTWNGATGPKEDQFAQAGEARGVEGAISDSGSESLGLRPLRILPVMPLALNWLRPEDASVTLRAVALPPRSIALRYLVWLVACQLTGLPSPGPSR